MDQGGPARMSSAVELTPEPAPAPPPAVGQVPPLPAPVPVAPVGPLPSTRVQRIVLGVALLVAFWLLLRLFDSVLAPFVAAAVIAYALDPPTSYLTRLGVPRSLAALLMILALLFALLLFALLLYPLILSQIGLF